MIHSKYPRRRFDSLLLGLVFVCNVVATPAYALDSRQESTAPVINPQYAYLFMIDPRFTHFSRISSGLDIDSSGRADCTGSYTIYQKYDYESKITITLQRFEDIKGWVDVQEWSKDYSGSGVKLLNKGYYVASGYRYRLIAVAEILDEDGAVLERISCDSQVVEH